MARRWVNSATGSVVAHTMVAGLLFSLAGGDRPPMPPLAAAATITFETLEAPPTPEPVAPPAAPPPPSPPAPRPRIASVSKSAAPGATRENSGPLRPGNAQKNTEGPDVAAPRLDLPTADSAAEHSAPFVAPLRSLLDDPVPARKPALELKPIGGGRFEADKPGFKAHVSRDGTMTFSDKPNLRVYAKLPRASVLVSGFSKWFKDPYGYQKTGARDPFAGTSLYTTNMERGIADEPAGNDNPEDNTVMLVGLGGSFDLSDWALRAIGDDPYASEKLRLLEESFDMRTRMRTTETTRRLRRSLHRLPLFLRAVWNDERVNATDRRRNLFALWDECAEQGSKLQLEVAAAVRASIVAFVRRELPPGSEYAFSNEELARLNRKRSSTRLFAPYGTQE